MPAQTTPWCSISQNVLTNASINNWGFLLWAAINWLHSSLHTPAVHYIVSWPPSTLKWSYWHLIACCFFFLLRPALSTVLKYASWVIFLVAAIAVLRSTTQSLGCCCVSPGGSLVEVSVVQLDSDPIAPGWCVSGGMTCCCGKVRKMIMKRSGKSWRLYSYLEIKMEWVTANLHLQFKLNPAAYRCRGFQWYCNLQ